MVNKPLVGKTIFLTGSNIVKSVLSLIKDNGAEAYHFPLIETVERFSDEDNKWLSELENYGWIIFTSQSAVHYFIQKCLRHSVNVQEIQCNIATVGEKTAALIQQYGLTVHFQPTIYSADIFVQQFQMAQGEKALFIRGSLAKSTIREGVGADEWTVYETQDCVHHIEAFRSSVQKALNPIVIFASPSAVNVYNKHIAPFVPWELVKIASIGHVTTNALQQLGVEPALQPSTYTLEAVIEQLIMEEQTS